MFNLNNAIEEWRRQMMATGIKSPAPLDELECHLRDEVEQQMRLGLDAQKAFEAAVQRIGPASALQSEFKKLGGARWRRLRKLKRFIFGFTDAPFLPLSNFSPIALQSLEIARAEPLHFGHDFIGTEHVLLGLLKLEQGIVPGLLRRLGLDQEVIRREIARIVGAGPVRESALAIPYTPRAKRALFLAVQEAKNLRHSQVGAEHIFLGLLAEVNGVAALVLKELGCDAERIRAEILKELD